MILSLFPYLLLVELRRDAAVVEAAAPKKWAVRHQNFAQRLGVRRAQELISRSSVGPSHALGLVPIVPMTGGAQSADVATGARCFHMRFDAAPVVLSAGSAPVDAHLRNRRLADLFERHCAAHVGEIVRNGCGQTNDQPLRRFDEEMPAERVTTDKGFRWPPDETGL